MKPIIPNCLALVISGKDTGKTVRAISRHEDGSMIDLPNGTERNLNLQGKADHAWLCLGNVHAVGTDKKPQPGCSGFAMYLEAMLMRIDAEGDDDLIEEFASEAWADVMAEQMKKEGIKRLW